MSGRRATNAVGHVFLQVGQPFNPFGLFNGVWVPECLARCGWLSAGAKLAWARLARYAGRDGRCYPTMKALGLEIGVGERQAQKYVAELERHGLLRRVSRYLGRSQTSNGFEFLWHELFEEGVNDRSPGRVNDQSGEGVNDRSPKESQSEESQIEEETTNKRTSGYASQKTRSAASLPANALLNAGSEPLESEADGEASRHSVSPGNDQSACGWTEHELAEVRYRIVQYWGREPEEGFEVSVMLRSRGATASAVCELLDRKFKDKNLRPGGKWAPKSQNWFLTIIENEFAPGHLPEPPTHEGDDQQKVAAEILKRGIEVIELPHAPRSIVESVSCVHCGREALVTYTDGTVEGCGCQRQVRSGGLKRITAIDIPDLSNRSKH